MFLPGKSFCAALLLGEPRDYPVSVTYALKGFFRSRGWSWGMDCGASAPRQHVVPPLGATDSQRLFLLCQPWLTVTCCFPGAPVPTFGQSTPVPGAVGSGSGTLSFRTPSTPASSFGGVGTSFGKEGVGASAHGSWCPRGLGAVVGPGVLWETAQVIPAGLWGMPNLPFLPG